MQLRTLILEFVTPRNAVLLHIATAVTKACYVCFCGHYSDVTISAMAPQVTSLTIVYSTVYSGTDKRKHQSSASLAFVGGIHRWPVNSLHKRPVTRKMFPFDDVIMNWCNSGVQVPDIIQMLFLNYWTFKIKIIHHIAKSNNYYSILRCGGLFFKIKKSTTSHSWIFDIAKLMRNIFEVNAPEKILYVHVYVL